MYKRISLALAVIVLLLPSALIGALLYTQTGLQLIVGQLWRIPGVAIRVQGATGRLAGPLDIEHLELDHARVHIVADKVALELQATALLTGVIKSNLLEARNVVVELKPAQDSPAAAATTLHFLPRSMRIAVDNIDIRTARFIDGSTVIDADHVLGNAQLTANAIDVHDLQIESALADLRGELRLKATQPLSIDLDSELRAPTPHGPNIAAHVKLSGNAANLTVVSAMSSPATAAITGTIVSGNDGWQIDADVKTAALSLAPWLEKPPFSFAQAALKFRMNAGGMELRGDLTVPEVPAGPMRLDARGRYADRTLTVERALLQSLTVPTRLNARGRVRFQDGPPDVAANVDWNALQWPLRGAATVTSAHGSATLQGSLPYMFTVSGAVQTPQLSVDAFSARGALTQQSLIVDTYEVQLLGGMASGKGTLQFAEPRAWTLEIDGRSLNPKTLASDWPGELALAAHAHGIGLNTRTLFTVNLERLQGRLRNQPLQGHAIVERTRDGWRTQNLRASFGPARIVLDGKLEKTLDAKWSLQNVQLEHFASTMAGHIDSAGAASGTRDAPRFAGDIQVRALHYGDWNVAVLDADADIDLAPDHVSHLNVEVHRVGTTEPRLETVIVEGRGSIADNTFLVKLQMPAADRDGQAPQLTATFAGRMHESQWQGTLDTLRIDGDWGGPFVLAAPAGVQFSRDAMAATELCLTRDQARLCGQGHWSKTGSWQLDASATDVPLAFLEANQTADARLQGQLRADMHLAAEPDRAWTGKLTLDLKDSGLRYQNASGTGDSVSFGDGHIDALATAQQISAHLHVATAQSSVIDAHGALDRTAADSLLAAPLNAVIHAHTDEAKLLPFFVADVDRAAGELDVDAQISGTLRAPRVNGLIALKNAELDAYRLNLALREVSAQIQLIANEARVSGSAKAGEGVLKSAGTFTWHESELTGALHVQGEQLLIADLPEYRVVASPNLDFNIANRKIAATGSVVIPSARIQPKDLSGTVQASSDARMINDQRSASQSGFQVSSDISVEMGDDVRLDTFGLQGKLGGSVHTLLMPGETPLGRGELVVSDGRYTVYGQKLDIKRGRLLFERTSLDDPGLDVQAERKIEQVAVGVNVRGTLHAPTLQLYSEPSMSQAEMVSYLIVGKPLDRLQGAEAATVSSVRNTVALQGGGLLASQLGHRIGLEEVGVETTTNAATNTTTTSLVLGKFLSPRLFVSYGISLTEAINTLKLRYTISDHWVLKTEAGQRQGADVEYTIER